MSDNGPAEARGTVARRRRAWWQWAVGIGLLAAAAAVTIVSYAPGLRAPAIIGGGRPKPAPIRVAEDLRPADSVPASPGELAGANVLLVTFDTTRADRIGCYGSRTAKTPAVDRLAREGVLFANATATSPTTLPSHSSMMTGLYPYHHGARANNAFRLDEGNVTLAEVLAGEGYKTAAMVSAFVLDRQFGIDQGFGHFDDEVGEPGETALEKIAERRGDETTAAAVSWLRSNADGPFFLWVHYYDAHSPYEPPAPFDSRYAYPYDGEVAFADSQLGELLAVLDELALTDGTLVVLAGDHGEGLGQHEEAAHAFLVYDSTLRVPFVMRCGRRLGGGVHLDLPVSLVDLMPTVLSLLGVPAPGGMDGADLTQPPAERPIFFETFQGMTDYGWAALLGVQEGPDKYIHGPYAELYDLDADPFERSDLIDDRPQVAARLKETLQAAMGGDLLEATSVQGTHQLAGEDLAKLQALGYMGGTVGELPPGSKRPHPREMMPALARALDALAIENDEGLDAMIARLEALVDEEPGFAAARQFLADAYRRNGDLEEAEREYAVCMELRPGDPEPMLKLAEVLVAQFKGEEAIKVYELVLDVAPDRFEALTSLAAIHNRRGEYEEAVELLTRALAVRPRDREVPDKLVDAMLVLARSDDAIALFRGHLEADPDLPMVRNGLARLLVQRARYEEAIEVLRDGLALSPQSRPLINNLAIVLATCADPRYRHPVEGVIMMERLCTDTGYAEPRFLHTLALTYAAQLRIDEAIAVASRARDLAAASEDPGRHAMVPAIAKQLQQYRNMKKNGVHATDLMRPVQSAGQ